MKIEKLSLYNLITMPMILLDGFFHSISSGRTIETTSPDWIIAKFIFAIRGLPVSIHRLIGIFLLSTTIISFILITKNSNNRKQKIFINIYNFLIVSITLLIIAISIIIKNFFGS